MNELAKTGVAVRSFYTFRLGPRLGGIELSHVREISPHLPTTPVPQAPPAVRGLTNLRSRIYLVLDLRPLLGSSPTECTAESRLIILKPEVAQDVSVLVESGADIVHVKPAQIEPASSHADVQAGAASSMITDVCKLELELLMIVDPKLLIDAVTKLLR
ncbi:MAG: chemotaxis protein CheW [Anaerolineae bacterium]|nr:chemotaxis protein CheW [Phycisphaerae bacterium]